MGALNVGISFGVGPTKKIRVKLNFKEKKMSGRYPYKKTGFVKLITFFGFRAKTGVIWLNLIILGVINVGMLEST